MRFAELPLRFHHRTPELLLLVLPAAAQLGFSGLGNTAPGLGGSAGVAQVGGGALGSPGGNALGGGTLGSGLLGGISSESTLASNSPLVNPTLAGLANTISPGGSPLGALGSLPGTSVGGNLGVTGGMPLDIGMGPASSTLNKAFHYADIASQLLTKPSDFSVEACRELCVSNVSCAAWEVCTPLGEGCEGCYLIKRAPKRFAERPGWHAAVLEGREVQPDPLPTAGNMTIEECHTYLLEANGADQSQPFHEPENMRRYVDCGFKLRNSEKSRQLSVQGKHYPTFLMTHFTEPSPELPKDVEVAMFDSSNRQPRHPPAAPGSPGLTSQLHQQVGTTSWEEHLREKPTGPHAFVLPFYDTNIGHWVKQHGSMNPLQSYEMQSLLQEGDVFIDVGANLGCYTVPLAERVGPLGKVLAFEPFRLLHQITSANVALNGLSNTWIFPVGLGTEFSRFEARPPQLRFFSSPGGMKLQNQQQDLKQEEQLQLYDWDSPPEAITVVSLDELMLQSERATLSLGFPVIQDLRLIKIDVEGMEREVITGAQQTIRHFKPIIWTENVAYFASKGQDVALLQILDQLEYSCAGAQNAPNDVVCTDKHGRGHQIIV